MDKRKAFTEEEIKAIAPLEKFAVVSCLNPEGLVHLTFLNTLMAQSPDKMTIGQFCRGLSKWYMQNNPKVSFFILTPEDKKMWRGKAKWTHKESAGLELDKYKEMPLQRYNAYFPVSSVHYLDLVEVAEPVTLPVVKAVQATLFTKFAMGAARTNIEKRILKPYAEKLFNRLTALKFISYVGEDGFPKIVPALQCQAADSRRLVFSIGMYKEELAGILPGTTVGILSVTTTLESVLVRGKFQGYRRYRGVTLGIIDIEWVYNSMLPNSGQIYPEQVLKPVVDFEAVREC
jgi:hypothetical protein